MNPIPEKGGYAAGGRTVSELPPPPPSVSIREVRLPEACKHCKKPIIRCDSAPSHAGCSSARGYLHDATRAHGCQPRSDGPYAEPGSDGHREPWEPWAAPVMVLAGMAIKASGDGGPVPWLYLACRCGWWLGYGPQYDPAGFAHIASVHGENCELRPANPAPAGEKE